MDADAYTEKLRAFEGLSVAEPARARDPVNEAMIRHWCDAVDDRNPSYTDPEFAARSVHGGLVAPPTMLQAWTMPGPRRAPSPREGPPSPLGPLFALLDEAGFTSVVATNCTQEYRRYLRPGDRLEVVTTIEAVSAQKRTALGIGHFVTERMVYRDQHGEEVAVMRFRMLKFRPTAQAQAGSEAAPAAPRPRRPRPGITRDNAFFWEAVERGELRIQRCTGCGALRHPPGPMCPGCRSLEWDGVRASGRGHVYSFVVAHHPPIPPFSYPNPIALVELEEGVRLVGNLVDVPRERLRIGLPVRCEIVEVEPGLRLPRFRPEEP